jgi:quinol monooxygenase YgiN
MSIQVVLELQAAEGKADEMKAVLKNNLGDTRARSGCQGVTVHQDQDTPTTIVLLERWATRADYESYLAWRAGPGAMPEMATLVTGPPSIRYFDDVDA